MGENDQSRPDRAVSGTRGSRSGTSKGNERGLPDGDRVQDGRKRMQDAFSAATSGGRVLDEDFDTLSGLELAPVYGPRGSDLYKGFERIGWPGQYPFTRGLYPTGYRGKPWTIRQFAGFGTVAQTNARFRQQLEQGAGGCRWRSTCRPSWVTTVTTLKAEGRLDTAA